MKVYELILNIATNDILVTCGIFSSIDKVIAFIEGNNNEQPLFKKEDILYICDHCIRLKNDNTYIIEIYEVDNVNYDTYFEEIEEVEKRLKQEFE